MPVLDRQAATPSVATTAGTAAAPRAATVLRPPAPRVVAETAPTPLQRHYVNLSAIALVAGAIAITALETGASLASPVVKIGILVAAPILIATTADASLRIWRSAWAWLPVNRGRGLFRFSWLVAAAVGIAVFATAAVVALLA